MPSVDYFRHVDKSQHTFKLAVNSEKAQANFLVERNAPSFGNPLNGCLTFPLPHGIAVTSRGAEVKVELFKVVWHESSDTPPATTNLAGGGKAR